MHTTWDNSAHTTSKQQFTSQEWEKEDARLRSFAKAEMCGREFRSQVFADRYRWDATQNDFRFVREDGSLGASWKNLHNPTVKHDQYQALPQGYMAQALKVAEEYRFDSSISRAMFGSPAVRQDGQVLHKDSDRGYITEVNFVRKPNGEVEIVVVTRESKADAVGLAADLQRLTGKDFLVNGRPLAAGETGLNAYIERGPSQTGNIISSLAGEGHIFLDKNAPVYAGSLRYINPYESITPPSQGYSQTSTLTSGFTGSTYSQGFTSQPSFSHSSFSQSSYTPAASSSPVGSWSVSESAQQYTQSYSGSSSANALAGSNYYSESQYVTSQVHTLGVDIAHPMQLKSGIFKDSNGAHGAVLDSGSILLASGSKKGEVFFTEFKAYKSEQEMSSHRTAPSTEESRFSKTYTNTESLRSNAAEQNEKVTIFKSRTLDKEAIRATVDLKSPTLNASSYQQILTNVKTQLNQVIKALSQLQKTFKLTPLPEKILALDFKKLQLQLSSFKKFLSDPRNAELLVKSLGKRGELILLSARKYFEKIQSGAYSTLDIKQLHYSLNRLRAALLLTISTHLRGITQADKTVSLKIRQALTRSLQHVIEKEKQARKKKEATAQQSSYKQISERDLELLFFMLEEFIRRKHANALGFRLKFLQELFLLSHAVAPQEIEFEDLLLEFTLEEQEEIRAHIEFFAADEEAELL